MRNRPIRHPGEFLQDELDERGLTYYDLSLMSRVPLDTIRRICTGKLPIARHHAKDLAKALGTSKTLWLELDRQYRYWMNTASTPAQKPTHDNPQP